MMLFCVVKLISHSVNQKDIPRNFSFIFDEAKKFIGPKINFFVNKKRDWGAKNLRYLKSWLKLGLKNFFKAFLN